MDMEVRWELVHRRVTSGMTQPLLPQAWGPAAARLGVFLFKSFLWSFTGWAAVPVGAVHTGGSPSVHSGWVTCPVRTRVPLRVSCSQAAHFSFTTSNLRASVVVHLPEKETLLCCRYAHLGNTQGAHISARSSQSRMCVSREPHSCAQGIPRQKWARSTGLLTCISHGACRSVWGEVACSLYLCVGQQA